MAFLRYAVETFAFLIRGKGRMSGKAFANEIREHYDCVDNVKNKACADYIERHIVTIVANFNGTGTYKSKF